jgi:hypothetical protein
MSSEKKKQQVVVRQEAGLPEKQADVMAALAIETATGFENVKPTDTAIPFIGILQSLSPQVKRGHAQRIEGATEGMLFNSVTQEIYEGPLRVIPCAFQKAYVEWVPRESGGGFVKQHPDESILASCTRNEKNIDTLPNGNQVVPTAYHFILVEKPDGLLERAVLSMTRTQLKKSRRWLSQMINMQVKFPNGKTAHPPMFSHSYEVSTVLETRDSYSWYGFTLSSPRLVESMAAYVEAKKFYAEIVAGGVSVKPPEEHMEEGMATGSEVI